ncbi:MAG: hypothetical protein ACERNK_16940 [Deltaproteobacteria bacterium]
MTGRASGSVFVEQPAASTASDPNNTQVEGMFMLSGEEPTAALIGHGDSHLE